MLDPAPADRYLASAVLDCWDETRQLHALAVELDGEHVAHHRAPGQVVKLRVASVGESYFALASAPGGSGRVELLLKRGAPVADAVIERKGGSVELTAPFGRGFPVEAAAGRDLLLFASGSGIAPIRAMIQHVAAERARFGRVDLYYGQRAESDFAYRREHDSWRSAGIRIVECASRPTSGWSGAKGHVQDVVRESGLSEIRIDRAAAFVCGMKPMVAGVRELLAGFGLADEQIHSNF